jgi:hypothetical protein
MAVIESGILAGMFLWVQSIHRYAGIRGAWFVFAFSQLVLLGSILFVAAGRRIELRELGMLSTVSGGMVRRFVPWSSVKGY